MDEIKMPCDVVPQEETDNLIDAAEKMKDVIDYIPPERHVCEAPAPDYFDDPFFMCTFVMASVFHYVTQLSFLLLMYEELEGQRPGLVSDTWIDVVDNRVVVKIKKKETEH